MRHENQQIELIEGTRLRLRPAEEADAPTLIEYMRDPEVARWWSLPDDPDWPLDDDKRTRLAIEVDDEVAGMIQYAEETEADYRHAVIDIFVGPPFYGRGLGREAVATLVRYLVDVRGHHRVTIAPAVANERAIATYEKVGFRPVGVLRQYEHDHVSDDWHDNLLMDLLASDL